MENNRAMEIYKNSKNLHDILTNVLTDSCEDFERTFRHRIGGIVNNDVVWSLVWSGMEGTKPVLAKLVKSTMVFTIRRVDLSFTKYIFGEEKFDTVLLIYILNPGNYETCEELVEEWYLDRSTRSIYDMFIELLLVKS